MTSELSKPDDVDRLEAALLDREQIEIPVEHTFSPGLYVRTIRAPAGAIIVGHRHRAETLNFLMQGRLLVIVDGQRRELSAPCILPSAAGTRKAALILEDVVWTNVHPNPDDQRDLAQLEQRYIEKSQLFLAHEARELAALQQPETKPEESPCRG